MREKDFVKAVNNIHIKDSMKRRIYNGCRNYRPTVYSSLKMPKKVIAVACVAAFALVCSVTVFATNMFGLKDLIIRQKSDNVSYSDEGDNNNYNYISLQGYANSDEAKACAEWNAFLDTYDADGKILKEIGNKTTEFDKEYICYTVYTQEMADKLNEIANKYNLKLLKSIKATETFYQEATETPEELFNLVGKKNFIRNTEIVSNVAVWGYVYNEGSFHVDGQFNKSGVYVDYQLSCYKKGSFVQTALTIDDAESYRESEYTTKGGTAVRLAMGPDRTLIILDMGDQFVTVNILSGYSDEELKYGDGNIELTLEDVKAMADTFDFAALQ